MGRELEQWHDFYVLLGTAGATLVALLFVAVSLGGGYLNQSRALATRTFFSTVVIHFAEVFLISAIALIPGHRTVFFAVVIGGFGLAGLAVSAYASVQLVRHKWTEYLQDHFAYGLLPALAYGALLLAAVAMLRDWQVSLDLLAGALLLLLSVNIRNAWDLMLSMVRGPHLAGDQNKG
ncbi:MAG TPA: hypothetical protein VG270_07795 [Pseudolabrys sp.]|jgi:hypothetical protein|nr:hypothetical protein [Pseudolabrys sp.]